ncbi:hypothetical protein REPUB_Repub20aG0015400 [Reevesia pubescens]
MRFLGMPLKFYDNDILLKMGNAIGKTLMVDKNTMVALRGKYACICIEVNLTKPLVPKIFIRGRWQSIEYEGLGMEAKETGDESSKYGPWMIATKNYRKPRQEASPNPKQKQNFGSPIDATSEKQSSGSRFTILNEIITEQEDKEVSPTTKNKFINTKIWSKSKQKDASTSSDELKRGLQATAALSNKSVKNKGSA